MTEITMYDYILEEKDVLLNILQKRKTITRPFCTLLQEKNVDELVPVSYTHLDVYKRQASLRFSIRNESPRFYS